MKLEGDESVLDLLAQAIEQFLSGDLVAGRHVLAPVSGITIADRPLAVLDVLPDGAYQPGAGPLTKAPGLQVQAQVFARDR